MQISNNVNVAINGFGRIGRAVFKSLLNKKGVNVIAINDLTHTKTLVQLLQYDSCYGVYGKKIDAEADNLIVDKKKYKVLAEKEPIKLPWGKLKVDIVLECTGRFLHASGAGQHVKAGAKKVIISAPVKDGEQIKTIVLSVNEKDLTKADKIISMASCTTNCLAPVMKIISDNFGIKKAIMSTIHSYTADQNLVDGQHKDLRRARAAAVNIVPTTTGAALATAKTIPELVGKFDGLALRVPTPVVSLCDTVFITEKQVTAEQVNQVLKNASVGNYKGYVAVTEEPLVSSDFIGNPASAIVDLSLTKVIGRDLLKIISWYDNEWGYSCRLADLCLYIAKNRLL
ncbi:type I glyceraldehyde-3-phosphate dehydrogenase [Patescibacteria group bacterium]|nr:type I glyceraldehyde-3-phosphate dehydrogenase [Patescibacteria group bacterium]MBU1663190.1 type I glyceraldehyde-3-phosphate dehydrogenase [Patescibacteria group bacterium]MBU1934310.1 type I glyceraldehyde-3-phosphate dehydrogenase [Patescibacteria group bacterium]MBU2007885.1 type I glyceraldehyde-3-phosphate dehydrogenase [Patescibacteria group bacterium]MBU2233770.1 type I glyceraldehyde-3-phosphate dehydrogenase [Patescibacteria group bacterium]